MKDQAAIGREAKNSRVQGTVADLLAQAGVMMYQMSQRVGKQDLDFRILLPIHDAFLFEVKNEHAARAVKLITMCMSTNNRIPGTDYKLGLDIEIRPRSWGDKGMSPKAFISCVDESKKFGVDLATVVAKCSTKPH
jgi:DNA polymerase I-like protein with 3'-5' exonuclease and polymerase domains